MGAGRPRWAAGAKGSRTAVLTAGGALYFGEMVSARTGWFLAGSVVVAAAGAGGTAVATTTVGTAVASPVLGAGATGLT